MIEVEQFADARHIRIDDGGVNVITLGIARSLLAAIESAADDGATRCVIIEGNSRALSVGLDTETVLRNDDDSRALLATMGQVLKTLYLSRLRSIVIAQGHATAAGAMLLLVADRRIGCGAGGKVGLSEVRFGLGVPRATQQLVRDRISARHQFECTALATLYDYGGAEQAGFLDVRCETPEASLALAREMAADLCALDEAAYLETKTAVRSAYANLVD